MDLCMGETKDLVFECVRCAERFSVRNIEQGSFFASTLVCLECYTKAVEDESWCFGTYDAAEHRECRVECPDRKVCKVVTHSRKMRTSQNAKVS